MKILSDAKKTGISYTKNKTQIRQIDCSSHWVMSTDSLHVQGCA